MREVLSKFWRAALLLETEFGMEGRLAFQQEDKLTQRILGQYASTLEFYQRFVACRDTQALLADERLLSLLIQCGAFGLALVALFFLGIFVPSWIVAAWVGALGALAGWAMVWLGRKRWKEVASRVSVLKRWVALKDRQDWMRGVGEPLELAFNCAEAIDRLGQKRLPDRMMLDDAMLGLGGGLATIRRLILHQFEYRIPSDCDFERAIFDDRFRVQLVAFSRWRLVSPRRWGRFVVWAYWGDEAWMPWGLALFEQIRYGRGARRVGSWAWPKIFLAE